MWCTLYNMHFYTKYKYNSLFLHKLVYIIWMDPDLDFLYNTFPTHIVH